MEEDWDNDDWAPNAPTNTTSQQNTGSNSHQNDRSTYRDNRGNNSGGYDDKRGYNDRRTERNTGYNDQRSNRNSGYDDQRSDRNSGYNDQRSDRNSGYNDQRSNKYNDGQSDNDGSATIEVDQGKVGTIIGRGGSKIKEIEERFRVKVRIGESLSTH